MTRISKPRAFFPSAASTNTFNRRRVWKLSRGGATRRYIYKPRVTLADETFYLAVVIQRVGSAPLQVSAGP